MAYIEAGRMTDQALEEYDQMMKCVPAIKMFAPLAVNVWTDRCGTPASRAGRTD
jgi:hypothetical protein